MRATGLITGLAVSIAWTIPAMAQSALEGPLQAPDAAVTTAKPSKSTKSHLPHRKPVKTANHPAKSESEAYGPATGGEPHPVAKEASPAAPSDPVSFGMKWNGANDDARQTRIQNYNGDAAGSGGEVGLKLHF